MSLADYDGKWGGDYLPVGNHVPVTISSVRMTEKSKAGNTGVEFSFQSADGRKAKGLTFWLTEPAMGKLAKFAQDCGMSKQDRVAYDPFTDSHHQRFLGRQCGIVVVKDGDYHKVDSWFPVDGEPPQPAVEPARPPSETEPEQAPADDNIPF